MVLPDMSRILSACFVNTDCYNGISNLSPPFIRLPDCSMYSYVYLVLKRGVENSSNRLPEKCFLSKTTGQQSEIIEKRQKIAKMTRKNSKKRLPERCFLSSTTGSRSPVLPGPPFEVTEDPNWWGVDRAGCGVGLWWPPRPRCEVGPPVAAPTKNTNKMDEKFANL